MRIMTSNIWGDYFGNEVAVREDGLYEVFCRYSPDIIGMQEATHGWYCGKMFKKLTDEYVFVGTEIADNTNYVPLVYKKSSGLTLFAKGYEMLTDTPDVSKAITWAYFENKNDKNFAVCNTHFWWKEGEEHDAIRAINARQLCALMKCIADRFSCPVFSFGDMNTTIDSEVFDVYSANGVTHLIDIAKQKSLRGSHHGNPVRGDDGRYHGTTTEKTHVASIDHIVALNLGDVNVLKYMIVEDTEALDATDHSPVFADIEL